MSIKIEDRKVFLGIDPSFINMGLAIHSPATGTLQLFTGDFMEALDWINRNVKLQDIIVVLENPNLDKPVFKAVGMFQKKLLEFQTYARWLGSKKGMPPKQVSVKDMTTDLQISLRYAQNVGENKAAAKLIKKLFNNQRVPLIEIAPSKRQRADKLPKLGKAKVEIKSLTMPTKTSQVQFKELTGYSDQSSEHARDAATLVWGRTLRSAHLHFKWLAEAEGEENPELIYLVKGRKPIPEPPQKPAF